MHIPVLWCFDVLEIEITSKFVITNAESDGVKQTSNLDGPTNLCLKLQRNYFKKNYSIDLIHLGP